jgi:hypothetical protein
MCLPFSVALQTGFGTRAQVRVSQTIGKRQLPRRSDVLCHKSAGTLHHGANRRFSMGEKPKKGKAEYD